MHLSFSKKKFVRHFWRLTSGFGEGGFLHLEVLTVVKLLLFKCLSFGEVPQQPFWTLLHFGEMTVVGP